MASAHLHPGPSVASPGESLLIAAWWVSVFSLGMLIAIFGPDFMPPKFRYDAAVIQAHLDYRDLWEGLSFDGFVNTARVWSVIFSVFPQALAIPLYYVAAAAIAARLLDVFHVPQFRYHLIAGAWIMCAALFLSQPSKEMIALPIALFLCLAASRGTRFVASVLFLAYAALFRQYWAICYFYFLCTLFALRLHIGKRSGLAILVVLAAYALPFILAQAFALDPLTDARTMVNAERVDSPDARSAFNNVFENTGFVTDFANAVIAWAYMNVPLAMLLDATPQYVLFALFQLCSLWFFASACARLFRDTRRIQHRDSTYLRCAAFVIAYSMTQSIFEPDFGSFLRHEIVFVIPMLIVVFYRAHARYEPIGALALTPS